MRDALTREGLAFIVSRVLDYAKDAVEESKKNPDDEFVQGKRLAYYEILDTIRNELIVRDADLKSMMLEIDPALTT